MIQSLESNPRSAPRVAAVVQVVADTLDLVLRRGADANGTDAVDLLQRQLALWAKGDTPLARIFVNLVGVQGALSATPRGAPAGMFMEIHRAATQTEL